MLARLTFEKGKSSLMRTVYKRLRDYSLNGRVLFANMRFRIEDFMTLVKFGLNKFELIILNNLIESLQEKNSNIYGLTPEEWKIFTTDNEELEKILRALNKESEILRKITYANTQKEAKVINFNEYFNDDRENYFKDDFTIQEKFFSSFINCVVQLVKFLIPELEKFRTKITNAFHRIKDTVFIVDELLIILNLEHIFIWSPENQINFN